MLDALEEKTDRFRLLNYRDLANLPGLTWLVKGVLPATGIAGIYGPSGSGKSFLCLDLAISIAQGTSWFGRRVTAAPVVYAALEGEAGFKQRADAWKAHYGKELPEDLSFMLQPLKLPIDSDVEDFARILPTGCVVFIDTLNRAAPTSDENSSKDMGAIIEAAKKLQSITCGLVVLVHHTGKNVMSGLRGHSSLLAALDAAIEVSRTGDLREWTVSKAKDGADGNSEQFKLQVETLGIDTDGDVITSCIVKRDTTIEIISTKPVPQGNNQKLVMTALRPMFKSGETGKAGAPPSAQCIELEAAVSAGAAKLTSAPDKRTSRAREAISGLLTRGVIDANAGWIWLK
jgi:putative DNA primase/helicase